jgi:predicted PurR-regulated permease PerM
MRVMLGLCTAVLVAAALDQAQAILAPVAFALFGIALVWPLQRWLESRLGGLPALLLTLLAALGALVAMVGLFAWGFGRVAQWVIANGQRFQLLYAQKIAWLEQQGIEGASLLGGGFDMRWVVGVAQAVTGQVQGVVSFAVVTLVFVILGLLEVDPAARQLRRLADRPAAAVLLRAGAATAAKLRAYMGVRTLMSVATGLAVFAFAIGTGLELAAEWGVIAFVLNYIPFIGPLVATLFPTFFAVLQFEAWQAAIGTFAALQVIQFLSGSYIEPRLAGRRLAVSPFMVLVAVFLGAFLWGVPGAFIGVPVLIAALTVCEETRSARWVADLLSGRAPDDR